MLKVLKKSAKIIYDQSVKIKWSEKINNKENKNYKEILDKGIIKLQTNFENFSDYLNENYIKKLHQGDLRNIDTKVLDLRNSNPNNLINHYVGINDEIIRNFIENKELIEVLALIFNNNIYLRNDPLLQVLNTSEKMTNGNFHTDRYMQFSLMLLLEDVSENQTHMEFCKKSHKRNFFDLIIHKNFEECESYVRDNNFDIFKVIGNKGDAFLFNTTGVHRANYLINTRRSIFHLNFTNGHNLYPFKISFDEKKIKNEIYLRSKPGLKFTKGKWKFF